MARPRRKVNRHVERTPQFRVNLNIRIPEIRLVGENFDAISEAAGKTVEPGVFRTREAMEWARAMDLDLVEISPKANPPVCRIIDYRKFLYQKKKKDKEIKAKTVKTVIKEIRFGPNTDDHDFDFKVRHAKKFLEEGSKVKAYVHFRGRTIVFKDRGQLLLLKFLKELEEFGAAEALPKMEGRRMIVVVAPNKVKKKPKKSESDKKSKKDSGKKEQKAVAGKKPEVEKKPEIAETDKKPEKTEPDKE